MLYTTPISDEHYYTVGYELCSVDNDDSTHKYVYTVP